MWSIKELKKKARGTLKGHYFGIVLSCIIVMAISGTLNIFSTSSKVFREEQLMKTEDTALFDQSNSLENVEYANGAVIDSAENIEIVDDFLEGVGVDDTNTKKWTNGVLAVFARNTEGAGNIIYGILNALNQMAFKDRIGANIIIAIGVLVYMLIFFLFINVMHVGFYRYLLECRIYKDTKMTRILFPWSIKRGLKISWIMFVRNIYRFLWELTIVGGFIKRYSYRLVPMIAAENPDMSAKEVINLSRQMMNGHKMKAFLLDLSFIGWYLLSACTFGLLSKVFLNPYVYLTDTELYMELRKRAKADGIHNSDMLCDTVLDREQTKGEYPVDEYFIPTPKGKKWINSDYNCHYSISTLILIFFTFSFVGWLWEVSLHLFKDGVFVNRGVMHGPWLPIYGAGGVLVLVALKKMRDKPILTFLLTMALCGIVEYATSYFLEVTKGMKWWDYSGYFMNLNGRICLEGLVVFAIGGCAAIYIIAPALNGLYKKIPQKYRVTICALLLAVFIGDQFYSHFNPNSGKGITDYK